MSISQNYFSFDNGRTYVKIDNNDLAKYGMWIGSEPDAQTQQAPWRPSSILNPNKTPELSTQLLNLINLIQALISQLQVNKPQTVN